MARRLRIDHALAAGAHGALAGTALGSKAARGEAVREQRHKSCRSQPFAPIAIAPREIGAAAGEPITGMQRHDGRERAVARRTVEKALELQPLAGNFDRFRRGRRR